MSNSMRDPIENCPEDKMIVWPKDNELFIDIDNTTNDKEFEVLYTVVKQNIPEITYRVISRGSYGHKHIVVTFPEGDVLSTNLRVAFQATLASDRMRELLACIQLYKGMSANTCFFEDRK